MKIKTRLAIACLAALGGVAALAIAQTSPPPPPSGMTGSQAPQTAGDDSTLAWAVHSGPQSSSITINFPASSGSTGGGGGGGTPPFVPPQNVPIGSGVDLGVNNANSQVYWPMPAGIPNSTTGSYGPGGNLSGMYTPVTLVQFFGDFKWFTATGTPVTVSVMVGDHDPASSCTSDNEGDFASKTCTKTVTIGDSRWLFTVVGSGPTAHGCMLPPPPRSPSCRLTVHGSVVLAP